MKTLFYFATFALCVACSHEPCHKFPAVAETKQDPSQTNPPVVPQSESVPKTLPKVLPKKTSVKVFKYDGTRQCGQGTAITLEAAAQELEGITILSQNRMSDGLIRTQQCGGPTGYANVFEIPSKDLKTAQKRGFQVWKY